MESIMKLPDDMFKLELLPYLNVHDIVKLDKACMSHKYRSQLMDKISGVILTGDKDRYMKASLFKWLGMRQRYLINVMIQASDVSFTPSSIENDYVDQFRFTQHVVMRGPIRDDMAIFIISHCPCLLSINIGDCDQPDPKVTDHALQWIAEHCTGLQSLILNGCWEITDTGLMIIFENCTNLKSFFLELGYRITDASIKSISTHCTGLHLFNVADCRQITDASIISISAHCTGLQLLNLTGCIQITDASIISISTHCNGLHSLNLDCCNQITDASIISISTHCKGLQS